MTLWLLFVFRSAWHVVPGCNDDQETIDGEYRNIPEGMEYYSNRCLFDPQLNMYGEISNHNTTRQHWDMSDARTLSGSYNNVEQSHTSLAVQRLSDYSQKCSVGQQDFDKCPSLSHRLYFANPLKRHVNFHDNTRALSNQIKNFRNVEPPWHEIHTCFAYDDACKESQGPKSPEINNNKYLLKNDIQMSLHNSPMKYCAIKNQYANEDGRNSQSQIRKDFYVQYPVTANCTVPLQDRLSTTRTLLPMPHYKLTSFQTQSCAVASGCCSSNGEIIQCDVKTSIHMKIVDEPVAMEIKANIGLPTIGNFLEYLNDA